MTEMGVSTFLDCGRISSCRSVRGLILEEMGFDCATPSSSGKNGWFYGAVSMDMSLMVMAMLMEIFSKHQRLIS